MENIKVRVSSKAESKEVQELLFELGGDFYFGGKLYCNFHLNLITMNKNGLMANIELDGFEYEELTIHQLRDLVVLKRNDVADATHTCNGHKYYLTGSEFYEYINEHWENVDEWIDGCSFEPIEKKEMKEFLVNHNDKWTLQLLDKDTEENSYRVAVPSRADTATRDSSDIIYFWKNTSNETYVDGEGWKLCDDKEYTFLNTYIQHDDAVIIWQRHTQPEELPFIDDEPVNNPSHYTSVNIECLDAMQAMLSPDEFIGFLRGNIFKYQWRYKLKNGVEDLKKAKFYQNKLIELESKG